jgi:5-formyltetrahydrofolate cyclo-ligase
MNNSQIRKIYQQKRLSLTNLEVETESKKIADNFIANLLPKIANFSDKKLAFYAPSQNEVDPTFIVQHCQKLGNYICLPKISADSKVLQFKSYKLEDKLIENPFYKKILEPEEASKNIMPDIIFVPLVAFDKLCNRIGMGGGFYDATIKNSEQKNLKQIFIGLGYDWQKYKKIDSEEWDQKLNFVVLPSDIFSV